MSAAIGRRQNADGAPELRAGFGKPRFRAARRVGLGRADVRNPACEGGRCAGHAQNGLEHCKCTLAVWASPGGDGGTLYPVPVNYEGPQGAGGWDVEGPKMPFIGYLVELELPDDEV
jgi:hypothetical protein